MAKKKIQPDQADEARVSVLLSCVYSGHPDNPGPGDTVTVDAQEAAWLVGLGVAKVVETPVAVEPPLQGTDGDGNDTIEGGGNDTIEGGGNDTIVGGGNDTIDGGGA